LSLVEITAAKIKQDDSSAKARRAAVRYLGTVNCPYYPEAEACLIAALRSDRNESVRLEAAIALGTCQRATRPIIDALSIAVMGCALDGHPAEVSPRVRAAAQSSLNHCLSHGTYSLPRLDVEMVPAPTVKPVSHHVPVMPETIAPVISPTFSPEMQFERRRAETVSVYPTPAAPVSEQRTWFQQVVRFFSRAPESLQPRSGPSSPPSPRPLGLTPLGSEVNLSIPTPAGSQPRSP
jgi:hypothetical protein